MILRKALSRTLSFFADDTFFSIVHDPVVSAEEQNHDLNLISKWAHQWKMCFNPNPTKQAEEILFSQKRKSPVHPNLFQ